MSPNGLLPDGPLPFSTEEMQLFKNCAKPNSPSSLSASSLKSWEESLSLVFCSGLISSRVDETVGGVS